MLIIGAKGFAKEIIEVLLQNDYTEEIFLYDDVNDNVSGFLFDKYKILKSEIEVKELFDTQNKFTIGIGGPVLRRKLFWKFSQLGGNICSVISPKATIGQLDNQIGLGSNIMTGVVVTSSVQIGLAPLINLNCTIGHDCKIGDYLEMSPGSHISGNCVLGDYVSIGTNATILPKVKIGSNVIIGAGSVINKDVPDNSVVVGVPGKVIRELDVIYF